MKHPIMYSAIHPYGYVVIHALFEFNADYAEKKKSKKKIVCEDLEADSWWTSCLSDYPLFTGEKDKMIDWLLEPDTRLK